MENEKKILRKTIIKFGLILTVMCLIWFVSSYLKNEHLNPPLLKKVIGFIAIAVPIIFGIRTFKKENSGFLSFKEALKTGIGISAIASILLTIFYYVFLTVIEPDTTQQVIELYQTQGLDISVIQPWLLSLVTGFQIMCTSTIVTLITGLFLKKSSPEIV